MRIKRIVANVLGTPAAAARFYKDILGLDILMDMGWIATYGSEEKMQVQTGFISEGGSGAPAPDQSIEVCNLEAVLRRVKKAKIPVEYGPCDEPWGVRRFFVRDPFGKFSPYPRLLRSCLGERMYATAHLQDRGRRGGWRHVPLETDSPCISCLSWYPQLKRDLL